MVTEGQFRSRATLVTANHVSWLDIAAVHAVCPQARFVSKADVRHWPLLGWLIGAVGTLFIERERKRDAMRVVHQMAESLIAGDVVAVFPEGTTGDGRALLPFHANLLQAAIAAEAPVQPVALRYTEPGLGLQPGGQLARRDHAGAQRVDHRLRKGRPGARDGAVGPWQRARRPACTGADLARGHPMCARRPHEQRRTLALNGSDQALPWLATAAAALAMASASPR